MRRAGLTDEQIASYRALFNDDPVPAMFTPSGLQPDQPLRATGIPSTRLVGIAGPFAGENGIINVLRVRKGTAKLPDQTWYPLEYEWVFLTRVSRGSVADTISPKSVPWLTAQEDPLKRINNEIAQLRDSYIDFSQAPH
jgi:hypothetical protein